MCLTFPAKLHLGKLVITVKLTGREDRTVWNLLSKRGTLLRPLSASDTVREEEKKKKKDRKEEKERDIKKDRKFC